MSEIRFVGTGETRISLSGVQENKYLSRVHGVDIKICHEGH